MKDSPSNAFSARRPLLSAWRVLPLELTVLVLIPPISGDYSSFMHFSKYFLGDFSYFCAYSCVLFYIFQKNLRLLILARRFLLGLHSRETHPTPHTLPTAADGWGHGFIDAHVQRRRGDPLHPSSFLFFSRFLFLCAGGGGDTRRGVNCTLNAYYGNS